MVKKINTEKQLLGFSVLMGVVFTVMSICWGVANKSGAILFDGIYSGVSIILSLFSMAGLAIVNRPDDHNFQFGHMAFEPLIVALKAIVIVGICLYGMVTAVVEIIHGGAGVQSPISGMLYGGVSVIICIFSWRYLASKGKDMPDFVQAESEQWLIDIAFSGFVMLSFAISYALEKTALQNLVPYIDPTVVVCGSVYFIRVPLARLVSCVRELLLMAPPGLVLNDMHQRIDSIAEEHGFASVKIRSAKIGRELAVDIAFIARSDMEKRDFNELDAIRREVQDRLADLGYVLWLNVLFTKDEQWG